jgi:hypothetical protein
VLTYKVTVSSPGFTKSGTGESPNWKEVGPRVGSGDVSEDRLVGVSEDRLVGVSEDRLVLLGISVDGIFAELHDEINIKEQRTNK